MKYITPKIETLKAEEILEAMGPVQGYGGTSPGSPGNGLEAVGGPMGSPYDFGRR